MTPAPRTPVLVIAEDGDFEPGFVSAPSIVRPREWIRVAIPYAGHRETVREVPSSSLVLDTPANREAAKKARRLLEDGLDSVRRARAAARSLPRIDHPKVPAKIRSHYP